VPRGGASAVGEIKKPKYILGQLSKKKERRNEKAVREKKKGKRTS